MVAVRESFGTGGQKTHCHTSERKSSVSPGSATAVSGVRPAQLVSPARCAVSVASVCIIPLARTSCRCSPGFGRRQERKLPGMTRVGQHSGVVPFR